MVSIKPAGSEPPQQSLRHHHHRRRIRKHLCCLIVIVIGSLLSKNFVEFRYSIDQHDAGGDDFEHARQSLHSLVAATVAATRGNGGGVPHLDTEDHQHHVIIVPYRNRPKHRQLFLEHMAPYLKRNYGDGDALTSTSNASTMQSQQGGQLIHTFSIWIVEQDNRDLFHKGWVIDVGLAEVIRAALPRTTCIIAHDVDMVPAVDGVPYHQCQPLPMHLSSDIEAFNWKVPYREYFGGIPSLHVEQWRQINGFSLSYRGWGCEDDDVFYRIRNCGLIKTNPDRPNRPPKGFGRFADLDDRSQHRVRRKIHWNYPANFIRLLLQRADTRCDFRDGLSSVRYRMTDFSVENFSFGNASIPLVSIKATVPRRHLLPLFGYSSSPVTHNKQHNRASSTRGGGRDGDGDDAVGSQ